MEIALSEVRRKHPEAKIGEVIDWEITPANFGRIAAQTAKQAILQRLRQAEKSRISEDYRNKLNQLISGVVRRVEKGDVYIDFQRAEGNLRYNERIPREDYAVGDHCSALLIEVNADRPGPCLILSRSNPEFVRALFYPEVSEISENLVQIKAVAREPGYRTKIAVYRRRSRIDSCRCLRRLARQPSQDDCP